MGGTSQDRGTAACIQIVESLEQPGVPAVHEPVILEVHVGAGVDAIAENQAVAVPAAETAGVPADAAKDLPRVGLGCADRQLRVVLVNAHSQEPEIGIAETLAEMIGVREQTEMLLLEAEVQDTAVIGAHLPVDRRVRHNPVPVRVEPVPRPAQVVVRTARERVVILFAYDGGRYEPDIRPADVALNPPDGVEGGRLD